MACGPSWGFVLGSLFGLIPNKLRVLLYSLRNVSQEMLFKEVVQCCGSCGYPLNLTSSNRITSNIGSGYQKSIKKGYISFLSVDLSRFTQVDEYLSSSGCSEMPDSCLSFLQSYALKFLSLNLDCCFGITDNQLSLVAASCSSLELEAVNVSHCSGVNGSGLGGFSPTSTHIDADSCFATLLKILNLWLCRTDGDEVHCGNSKGMPVA
ncbi:hypothetical protein POTOM_048762 [Populus tomentosa]|uniref:Uncharacterized protein n=1 Tax=Populus tomentosa TaxID=118781 RepID=A0A8X7YDP4_POPTO|nr:hypothetical protein POTOM_048762 [Populus tomentosa]